MKSAFSFRAKWLIFGAIALVFFVAVFWQHLLFAVALAFAESRPTLLKDADIDQPSSSFNERFGRGSSEKDLVRWLTDNDFELGATGSASRTVRSLPCNETIEVSWTSDGGRIEDSRAIVSQDGCL
jgi:hypothetical protein